MKFNIILNYLKNLKDCFKNIVLKLYPYIKALKNKFVLIWGCIFVALIIFTVIIFNVTLDYYALTFNGLTLGYARNQSTVTAAIGEIFDNFSENQTVTSDLQNFGVAKIKSSNWFLSCNSKDELEDIIVNASDTLYNGYSLYIDGERVASLKGEDMFNTVIENFKADRISVSKYLSNNNDECTVTFKENLQIKSEYLATENIIIKDEYKTVYTILEEKLNYTINCIQTEEETVPYVTYYTRNADLYAGQKVVISKGVNGTKNVQYKLVVENGELISKTVINETVTKQAVTARIQIGSGITGGLGTNLGLIFPVEGYITSDFGGRADPFTGADSTHNGLDIGAVTGTPIYAASGGKVIQARDKNNGYGKCVIIEHSSGFKTLYAHCSEILVNEGDYVSAGDLIAKVGSTGRSTGPHLHYSIIINGNYVDPTLYY